MQVASFLGVVKPECIDSNQGGSAVGDCPKELRGDVSCWSVHGLGVHPHCLASCFAWGSWNTHWILCGSEQVLPTWYQAGHAQLSFPRQWSSSSSAAPLIALEMCDLQVKQSSRSNLLTSPQVLCYVLSVFLKLIILRSHSALDALLVFMQRKDVYNLVREWQIVYFSDKHR